MFIRLSDGIQNNSAVMCYKPDNILSSQQLETCWPPLQYQRTPTNCGTRRNATCSKRERCLFIISDTKGLNRLPNVSPTESLYITSQFASISKLILVHLPLFRRNLNAKLCPLKFDNSNPNLAASRELGDQKLHQSKAHTWLSYYTQYPSL